MIKPYLLKFTSDLLSHSSKVVRIEVGQLTGHCRLNKHLKRMSLADDSLYRFCQEAEETALYVLC